MLFTELVRFGAVVHRRQTGDVLHIGHERGSDDVVLILEEQGDIAIVPLAGIFRQAGIDDDVCTPGILLRDIGTGHRIAILRPLRTDDNGTVQSITRIQHDVPAIPHQRRRFLIGRMRVVGVGAALARTDGLIAAVVADVQALAVFRIEGQSRRKERRPARLHLVLQIHLDAITKVDAQRQRIRGHTAGHCRRFRFQREDLAFRHGHFDLPLEVHLDRIRRLRMELHRAIQRHDIEVLHRSTSRTDRTGGGWNPEGIRPLGKRLQIRCFLIEHAHDAPSAFGKV